MFGRCSSDVWVMSGSFYVRSPLGVKSIASKAEISWAVDDDDDDDEGAVVNAGTTGSMFVAHQLVCCQDDCLTLSAVSWVPPFIQSMMVSPPL